MRERRGQLPGRREQDFYSIWNVRIRDGIIFLVGIGGVIHELFILTHVRTPALVFLAAMIGMPLVLKADEKRVQREEE